MEAHRNPFRSACIDRLAFRGVHWDDALTRLESLGFRGAIVGPHGSGKTTLLDGLADRLGRAVVRIDVRPGLRPVHAPDAIALLDGLERLGWLQQRLWLARCHTAGAIATLHRDGPLPTWIRTSTTPELLLDLVAELIGQAPDPALEAWCADAFVRHRGDVRACLRDAYDVWSEAASMPTSMVR